MFESEIQQYSEYRDNWNKAGAPDFSKGVITNTQNIAKYLSIIDNIQPKITPTIKNMIWIEWEKENRYLKLEISEVSYKFFDNKNSDKETWVFLPEQVHLVINKIKMFHYNSPKRAVLFSGAFNPPTIAHYHVCESALNTGLFDFVIMATSNQSFLDKKQAKIGGYSYLEKDRLNMLIEMTYQNPQILVFGIEEGYTYDVLCAVKEFFSFKDMYFALGSDKLQEIGRWGRHNKLLKQFNFYILNRNDTIEYINEKCRELFSNVNYIIAENNDRYKDISATEVRRRIRANEDFSDLVHKNVYNYLIHLSP